MELSDDLTCEDMVDLLKKAGMWGKGLKNEQNEIDQRVKQAIRRRLGLPKPKQEDEDLAEGKSAKKKAKREPQSALRPLLPKLSAQTPQVFLLTNNGNNAAPVKLTQDQLNSIMMQIPPTTISAEESTTILLGPEPLTSEQCGEYFGQVFGYGVYLFV